MSRRGSGLYKKNDTVLFLRIHPELKQMLDERAMRRGESVNEYCIHVLIDHVAKEIAHQVAADKKAIKEMANG